jgi:hypothetical protein
MAVPTSKGRGDKAFSVTINISVTTNLKQEQVKEDFKHES